MRENVTEIANRAVQADVEIYERKQTSNRQFVRRRYPAGTDEQGKVCSVDREPEE